VEPEVPNPIEEALRVKDLVPLHELLSNAILTPSEVGTLLRVSPETVMKLASDGEIPSMRVKKETRMLRIDVLRYIRDLRDQQDRSHQREKARPRERVRR
jgi:excisionase family DNA binding protein